MSTFLGTATNVTATAPPKTSSPRLGDAWVIHVPGTWASRWCSRGVCRRGVEAEGDGEAAFAEGGVVGEREAVLELHLGFGGVVDVAELDGAAVRPEEG